MLSILSITLSVLSKEEPGSSMTEVIIIPWSSSGTSEVGVILNKAAKSTTITAKTLKEITVCLTKNAAPDTYLSVSAANFLSNQAKKPVSLCSGFLNINTVKAGVRVKATRPDITTDTAIVIANCWYIAPVMPPIKETGTNTAESTKTIATSGPETSFMASMVASLTPTPFSCIIRSTFSITIMASSTTMPIARTKPKSVRVLIEKPNKSMPAKAPTIETGTAKHGIKVARQSFKNRNTTANTNIMASIRVCITSSMETFTKDVVS